VPEGINIACDSRSYEELSKEFKEKASRAFELVPLMYNRLTSTDGLSHREAVKKIRDDHIHIQGFSSRSIRRHLPLDNPAVPRRVRPSWPKESDTQSDGNAKLSNNEQSENDIEKECPLKTNSISPDKPESSTITSDNSELVDIQSIEDEKQQLAEQVSILQRLRVKDRTKIKDLEEVVSNGSFVTAEQVISKMNIIAENINFEFSLYIEEIQQHLSSIGDDGECIDRLWISGSVNKGTGKVVEIHFGKLAEKNI